jgi:hypothetical protein
MRKPGLIFVWSLLARGHGRSALLVDIDQATEQQQENSPTRHTQSITRGHPQHFSAGRNSPQIAGES